MGELRHLPMKIHELMEQRLAPDMLNPGLFTVTFSNSKKQGRQGLQVHSCEGVLFSSGHVCLDTEFTPTHDFLNVAEMVEHFETYGICILQQEESE